MPYVRIADLPAAIYEVVIRLNGTPIKYLTEGRGITEDDRIAWARDDARKWANQYDKNAKIETPTVWG